jgi:plastocyanin domain-containing protein
MLRDQLQWSGTNIFLEGKMKYLLNIAVMLVLISGVVVADEKAAVKRFVATIDRDGYQRVEMTAGEYYFDPSVVVVKVNVPVELSIKKAGGITPHNLVMKSPEAGLDFTIDISNNQKKVSFMATKTGTYQFECTNKLLFFKSHKERGMHGVLEVVE